MSEKVEQSNNESLEAVAAGHNGAGNSADPLSAIQPVQSTDPETASAGTLLKRAREQAGWTLETLSGALKVPVKTLHAVEEDDVGHLPDLVFYRALASSMCRALKTDPAPVLALMPQLVPTSDIVRPEVSLNVPMGRSVDFSGPLSWLKTKSAALVAVIVLGIVAVVNWVTLTSWWAWAIDKPSVAVATPVSQAVASLPVAQPQVAVGASVATEANGTKTVVTEVISAGQTGAQAASAPTGVVVATVAPTQLSITVQASAPSWIEVTDGSGKTLWKRLLERGDPVQLAAPVGSRMAVGNAAATRVTVNGKAVDLTPVTNANVARMDLQ